MDTKKIEKEFVTGEKLLANDLNDIVDAINDLNTQIESIEETVIIDNLETTSTDEALSANMGKILNDRLLVLENAPALSNDYKKSTLQFYHQLGSTDSKIKTYTDEMRATLLNMEEFSKMGTGLFIHWGVYAVPAGNYTGVKQQGSTITNTSTNYNTEWIMRDLSIPRDIYKAYETQFNSDKWDTDALCQYAKDAGMGYIVITAKHHDGFCLYPSEYGSWDVSTSNARNTILDELKESCEKFGLKFGLYYSHYWDWMSEGGFGLNHQGKWNGSTTDLYTTEQHTKYCNEACKQLTEMVTKYEPYVLWYDPGANYGSTYLNIFANNEYLNYPDIITNDRLDYNRSLGDFGTGERTIYLKNALKYGEACFTMNNTWGYSDNNESSYYSIEKVFKQFIIYSLAYGQNCLMNIGPKKDGSIPTKQIECLIAMKNFKNAYGSFKNYKRTTKSCQPKWGYMLELENNILMCYIVMYKNQNYENITIDCIDTTNLQSVEILTPGTNPSYVIGNNEISISGLGLDSVTKIGVVRLKYSKEPNLLDANILKDGSYLPSRTFVMKSNQSFDFTNLCYNITPSYKVEHTTQIIWYGDTDNYTVDLDVTVNDSTDETITLKVKNVFTEEVQTITYGTGETTSDSTISLVNGKTYVISITPNGTKNTSTIVFKGLTFNKEIIIIHPTSVELNTDYVAIEQDGTTQLIATVYPENTTDPSVIWTSSNESVATVEQDGLVIAVAPGETIITVTTVDGNKTSSCVISVTAQSQEDIIHPNSVTLSEHSLSIPINDTHNFTYTILPENTTYKSVQWTSSNMDVATISTTGVLTSLSNGTTTIRVTSYDSPDIYDECSVLVHNILPTSITLNETSITIIPGEEVTLIPTILPNTTTNKNVLWTSSDTTIASISQDGVILGKSSGTCVITATTEDAGLTASCNVTVNQESYDYLFEALSLDGSSTQGADLTDVLLFSDTLTNWTLFGFVQKSVNTGQSDTNATLYQCVVDSSPWTGIRVDADNNNYPLATKTYASMLPRFLAGTDNYVDPVTGNNYSSKPKVNPTDNQHPVCFSRNGSTYKYSVNGKDWTEFTLLNSSQLARLKNTKLTIGFDYKRASGSMTTTKYRKLISEDPCCVAIKYSSEYPFYTLFQKYDKNLTDNNS